MNIPVVETTVVKKQTLEDIKILMEETLPLVYTMSLASGNQDQENAIITFTDGNPLDISYGYPIVPINTEMYWLRLIDISDEFLISRI
jgi:hypothetical protein